MTTCPACNTAVDPLRARFVGVRDGKVVAYCSAVCAAKPAGVPERASPVGAISPATGVPTRISTPATGVAARARTPATEVPARAQPPAAEVPARAQPPAADVPARAQPPAADVPARIQPPAADVPARAQPPTADVPARVQPPAAGVSLGPPRPATPAPGVPVNLDSGPVIEILHEPVSGVVTSARDARTEPRARHPDEISIAEFWSADQERSSIVADQEDPSGLPAPAFAAGDDAVAPLEVEPMRDRSERVVPDDAADVDVDLAPRRRRWPLVLLILVLLGGGGYLLYRYLVDNGFAAANRSPSASVASVVPAIGVEPARSIRPAEPTAVDVAAAVERARAALHRELAATSPRVRRLAAAALARTGDREACDLLAAEIGARGAASGGEAAASTAASDEPRTSDIARLHLAHALARGGDSRGSEVLAGALAAPRAEARDEAARLLALLGDHRAVPHLLDVLAVDQRRLGAAEHLAHLAEPHAIKVLDQVRSDARASAGDKARAIVALGIAGRGDVAGALRDMLGDPHFNAFAAAALAAQGDRSARPVLEHQLASPPLRVFAARALRRLDPAIDPALLLPLLDVVATGRDIERIPAAEAILILAGPAAWSAFD